MKSSDGGAHPSDPARRWSSSSLVIICLALSNLALGTLFLRGATPVQLPPPLPRPDGGSATNTACSNPCGLACYGAGDECFQSCYTTCSLSTTVRTGVLSPYLSLNAIQHVGVTVADLDRSVEWYTKVLGGVEVNFAGGNGWVGNDVEQLLMQHELLQGSPKADFTAGLQDGGPDQLDARYVNFGPLQIELLDYHSRTGEESNSNLPHYGTETAPSVAGNTHFAFRVKPETPLNEFVSLLEKESHERGFSEVKCNTLNEQPSDDERAAQVQEMPEYNSYHVDDGPFVGWQLAYCKGPDGEQLEFTHEYAAAGNVFGQALGMYVSGQDNPIWRRRFLRG